MKRIYCIAAMAALTGLCGCGQSVGAAGSKKVFVVSVEGAEADPGSGLNVEPGAANPVHRILRGADGKVLFAYDVQVGAAAPDGSYRLQLKPAKNGPTFAASREVTMTPADSAVRVDLMQQPGTGRKIADIYQARTVQVQEMSFGDRLMAFHNHIFKMIHGE